MENAEQIRDVATRMFARRGFDGTSLQAIADEVGITKPSLLYHYASKDELRRAVLGHLFEHWRQTLPGILEAVTSGHGRFEALTRELVAFFRKDPDRARLIQRELLDRPDEMRREMGDNLKPWVMLVAQYVRQGQDGDLLHADIDPEPYIVHVVTLTIVTVANLSVLSSILSTEGEKGGDADDRYIEELLRLVRSGLFKERGGREAAETAMP